MHSVDHMSAETGPSPARQLSAARRILLIAAILSGNAAAALLYDALPPILADLARLLGGGSTIGRACSRIFAAHRASSRRNR